MQPYRIYLILFVCLLSACQASSPTMLAASPTTAVATRISTATLTATNSPIPPTVTNSPTATHTPTPSHTPTPTIPPTSTATPTATPDVALYGQIDQLAPASTVRFWHSYTGYAQTVLEEMVAQFNKDNPYGITVEAVQMGGYGQLHNAVVASLADETSRPHLVAAFADKTAVYGSAVLDLRPYLHHPLYGYSPEELGQFWRQPGQSQTAVWGLPLHRTLELIYINDGWLASLPLSFTGPPQTPQQFAEAACAATDAANGRVGYQIELSSGNFLAWLFAFGATIYDDTTEQFTFQTPEGVAAMQFLQGLLADGCAVVADDFAYQTDFGAQKLLFGPGTTRGLYFYGRAVSEQTSEPFAWSVAAFPSETESTQLLLAGPDVHLLHSDPASQLAAWLFLKYFFTPDLQARWSQVNDHLPARADVTEQLSELFSKTPAYETAFYLMPHGQLAPAVTGELAVWQAILTAYGRVVAGESATDVLTQLDQTVNNYLANK